MISSGSTVNRKVLHMLGCGFWPSQRSRVPAALRSFSRSMICSLWLPTQLARTFCGGVSLVSTRMTCSPSTSTTSVSGVSPLISAITSEVGFWA